MNKLLIIQPAFLGDVILATALIEKLEQHFPQAHIDFLVRKGNQRLVEGHPKIRRLLVFDRKKKWASLWQLLRQIRKERYELVVNVQRHFSSGFITAFSRAKQTIGFRQNPFSRFFSHSIGHDWQLHEVERNQQLIAELTDAQPARPQLYPTAEDWQKVQQEQPYITISPASVWPTKQLPLEIWAQFINQVPSDLQIYLMGGPTDALLCQKLKTLSQHPNIQLLAGQQTFLQDVALMAQAKMNYVLDSAPLHICSAMNAPVCAVFCSTSPAFGFGPLSDISYVEETKQELGCRPCGKHGHKKCPLGHFHCSQITPKQLLNCLP